MQRIGTIAGVLLALTLAGCATTGKVVNNTFIDTKNLVDIQFPDSYSVEPINNPNSPYRVVAFYRNISLNKRAQTIIPTYGLVVVSREEHGSSRAAQLMTFNDFVKVESLNYCSRLYQPSANQYGEQTLTLRSGRTAIIRFYNSSCLLGSMVSAYGNGMAAFIDCGARYLKLEYIADSKQFNKDEFITILQSINAK